MFDLTVFPLTQANGREQYELPGLLITSAPRKAPRLRSQDQLLLYWTLVSHPNVQTGLTPGQQQEILHQLADTYFTTTGSLTAGLRTVVHRLNEFLLNRNLTSAQDGQWLGILNAAVLHNNTLMLAHAGPTHSFVLTRSQVLHFMDPQPARGLGFSRQAVPRFYQAEIQAGDLLVFCNQPPAGWTEKALANSPQLSLDHLRRRLFSENASSLEAVVTRFQAGKGQISYWRPGERLDRDGVQPPPVEPEPNLPIEPAVEAAPAEEAWPAVIHTQQPMADIGDETTLIPPWEDLPESAGDQALVEQVEQSGPELKGVVLNQQVKTGETYARPSQRPASRGGFMSRRGAAAVQEAAAEDAAALPAQPRRQETRKPPKERVVRPRRPNPLRMGLASLWRRGSAARSRAGFAIAKVSARVFPERTEPLFNIPGSTLLMIAIAVPLIVVAMATTVYVQAGRSEQYQMMIGRARQYAQTASNQTDSNQLRESWGRVYELAVGAEEYEQTEESQALKEQALAVLDELDGIVRLNYQPVGSSFGPDVQITKMVTTPTGVYLLDSAHGNIFHLINTAGGYEVNATFRCSSGKAGNVIVGPLLDIAPLSLNNELRASVVGIDAAGTVVYCSTGSESFSANPLAVPDAQWGKITAIATLNDTLYVLDPQMRAVYWYDSVSGIYSNKPHLYFDENSPDSIGDIVEMAVDQEFVYLLHSTGQMTVCETSLFSFVPTRCTESMPYGDARPGYDPAPLRFADARLTQLQITQPPDPSLFALDEVNNAIYHLSLRRLNLQRQYRPLPESDFPLPEGSPTAFVVTQNRRALLAFGDRVYFAQLP